MNKIHGIDMQNMYPSDKLKILLLERIAEALEKIAENKGEKTCTTSKKSEQAQTKNLPSFLKKPTSQEEKKEEN